MRSFPVLQVSGHPRGRLASSSTTVRESAHIATEPNYSGGEQEKEALINVVKLSARAWPK